jgi:hypothetical protein
MPLSPLAIPFFSCTTQTKIEVRENLLKEAQTSLSTCDFSLLNVILKEWENSSLLSVLFNKWDKFVKPNLYTISNSLNILSFNVRGLDLRMQEVFLLSRSFDFDVIILLEVGVFDSPTLSQLFSKYRVFYQTGENSHGGVVIMTRGDLVVKRIDCAIPNVCVVDLELEEHLRIGGVYGSESRTWNWKDLSDVCVGKCILFGDFNVDINEEGKKVDEFLEWTDSCSLSPCTPENATSLRSDRIIDFALSSEIPVQVQTHSGATTSDHKPILGTISIKSKVLKQCRNFHFKVFTLFLSIVYPFWEACWNVSNLDLIYNDYTKFLFLLSARCTTYFPVEKYRIAIPKELRARLSFVRALSFQQKRTGDVELMRQVKYLRKVVKGEIKYFMHSQLNYSLLKRHSSTPVSIAFWSRTKSFFKSSTASLNAFISTNGQVVRDPAKMVELAANYYEETLQEPKDIIRPHPLIDSKFTDSEIFEEEIRPASIDEVLVIVRGCKKKKSCDAHGLSSYLFNFIPDHYWYLLLKIFNYSFSSAVLPTAWKEARMIILAKKESICTPGETRPISLLDVFLKINERLFTNRFRDLLNRRGLLPDSQSGFRPGFRLQTRVLLFIEQVSSLMSNSSPVSTVFVDFKSAFDKLWIVGCIAKLRRMGIPLSYLNWIESWLANRRGFIEIQGIKSRWFPIRRGGPQGSIFTPTLFISFHADMGDFLEVCIPFFFADDLAAVIAGRIGVKYSEQCLDLEKRLNKFFVNLEYYSLLTLQPINYSKTEAMWSARAILNPKIEIKCGNENIEWTKSYKYLGYWISQKLGWGLMIKKTTQKIRKRVNMIRRFRLNGCTSPELRRALFSSYVLPLFTWLYPLIPLLSRKQQSDLSHFYYTCLKRTSFHLEWSDSFYAYAMCEISLEDRCYRYWENYLKALTEATDGTLLMEQAILNLNRTTWLDNEHPIRCLHRSRRYVNNTSIIEKSSRWCADNATVDSIPLFDSEDILNFSLFPETFF